MEMGGSWEEKKKAYQLKNYSGSVFIENGVNIYCKFSANGQLT